MELRSVDDLLDLLAACDGVYDEPPPYGDPVDLLQHGLQCADVLRTQGPDDVGLQLAGLVHDLGHAVPGGHHRHARTGAQLVRPLLGDRVAELVVLHVPAKRYLAATEREYALSSASEHSLHRQGGCMSTEEAAVFRALPQAGAAVQLRRADDEAKVVGRLVPGLDAWRQALLDYAAAVSTGQCP